MNKLPEDISTIYKTPMYLHGIELTNKINVAIRIIQHGENYTIWYFDKDQICRKNMYKKGEIDKAFYKNLYVSAYGDCWLSYDECAFTPVNATRNILLDKAIFKQVKEGEHNSCLIEIAAKTYLKRKANVEYTDFERLFQKIEKPIIIEENKQLKYVKICVNCATTIKKEDVIQNKKELDEWVLSYLENHRSFQKYQLPITILSVSNIILTRDKRLEYTFEIKAELRRLLE